MTRRTHARPTPEVPPEQPQRHEVRVTFSPAVYARVETAAAACGLSVPSYTEQATEVAALERLRALRPEKANPLAPARSHVTSR